MDKPDYYLEPTIQALVDVFGFDGNELRGLIQERPKQAYLRYKNGRQLSYDQKTEFEQTEKERNAAYRKAMMTISQDFALPAYGLRMNTEGSIHMVPLPAM